MRARARGDRGEQEQRLRQRAARAEVALGQPERREAQRLRALALRGERLGRARRVRAPGRQAEVEVAHRPLEQLGQERRTRFARTPSCAETPESSPSTRPSRNTCGGTVASGSSRSSARRSVPSLRDAAAGKPSASARRSAVRRSSRSAIRSIVRALGSRVSRPSCRSAAAMPSASRARTPLHQRERRPRESPRAPPARSRSRRSRARTRRRVPAAPAGSPGAGRRGRDRARTPAPRTRRAACRARCAAVHARALEPRAVGDADPGQVLRHEHARRA